MVQRGNTMSETLRRTVGIAAMLGLWALFATTAQAQGPAPANAFNANGASNGGVPAPQAGEAIIAEVRIEGHSGATQIGKLPKLVTRAGSPFDPKSIEDDVRALDRTRRFIDIRTRYQTTSTGLVVIFQVVEKPVLRYVKYIGMKEVKETKLWKEAGIKQGDAMDPHRVEEARRSLETYYHEHGFPDAYVIAAEGTKIGDKGAVFVINEGTKQSVWDTVFEGNEIATDARLRTQIESKHGFLWLFGGEVDPNKIESDVEKLTAYYRGLGFFQAKVGRVLEYDEKGWLTIRFVINEGPRYKLRKISTLGNTKFTEAEMLEETKMLSGEFFDQGFLNRDLTKMRDMYGSQGHIYCDVQADTRFVENEPGVLDIVYKVEEGAVYRVGQVNVDIQGDNPHTRQRTVMNRMSLRPGDIVDTRKIRGDELRLRRSQLFVSDPTKGNPPRIVISAPKGASEEFKALAAGGGKSKARMQSPDGIPTIDVTVQGVVDENGPWQESERPEFWGEVDRRAEVIQRNFGDERINAPALPTTLQTAASPIAPEPSTLTIRREHSAEKFIFQPHYSQPNPQHQIAPANPPVPLQRPEQSGAIHWNAHYPPQDASAPAPQPISPQAVPLNRTGDRPRLAQQADVPLQRRATGRETIRMQSPDPFATAPGSVVRPAVYDSPVYDSPADSRFVNDVNPLIRTAQPAPASQAMYSQGIAPVAYQNAGPDGQHVHLPNATPYVRPVQYVEPLPGNAVPSFGPPPVGGNGGALGIAPEAIRAPNGGPFNPIDAYPPVAEVPPGELGYMADPDSYVNLDAVVSETQTGRLMFGVGVNSNAGVIGNIVLDEQNFDIRRVPTSWADVWSGQAFRGAGQRFRIEAAPGTQVSRYTISFTEPYLLDTPISFSSSGFYFDRQYRDWFEQRVGGRFGLGYQFPQRPDLAVSLNARIENVEISNPRVPTPPQLQEIVGHNDVYGFGVGLTHDTRDSPFLPTEGWYAQYNAEYVTGSFNYPRATAELRKYYTLSQRADTSGRHVLAIGADLGITGDDTPIYDNFYAGGFSTLRGFRFRGASPIVQNVQVGGQVQLLGSVEYMMPITADDALRAVVFCDFGTIEETTTFDSDNLRVSPGFGLRISVPALGPAPIALDFAFPIEKAPTDQTQVFTFFIGLGR